MPDNVAQLVKQSFLRHLYDVDKQRAEQYKLYREYYDGDHPTRLTRKIRRNLELKAGETFRDNFCAIVVDALANRLSVTGFDTGNDAQGETFMEWWELNRMDAEQGNIHTSAVRDGDVYALVEWDYERNIPRISMELAFDGSDGVKMHYSDERRGKVALASKRWVITEPSDGAGSVRRINLYYPDRIEKYVSDDVTGTSDWQQYTDDDDNRWPIPWTRTGNEGGEPLGVSMLHFAYKSGGYNFGKSRMNDAIPLQNALNMAMIDLITTAVYEAFGILYMIGDEWGSISMTPGVILKSERPASEVSIGRIAAGDLKQLIELKNDTIMDIARVTSTPLSYFQMSGHIASEGTLKQQESGLVADAETTQVNFGNAWEDVMKMGRVLNNTFGSGPKLNEEQTISTQWKPAMVRDETELVNRLAVMGDKLHVSDEVLWARAGLTEDEIAMIQGSAQYQSYRGMQDMAMLLNEDNRE